MVVNCGFEPLSCEAKDYENGICCFFTRHAALESKSEDWLAWNRDNVSEWNNMPTCEPLLQ